MSAHPVFLSRSSPQQRGRLAGLAGRYSHSARPPPSPSPSAGSQGPAVGSALGSAAEAEATTGTSLPDLMETADLVQTFIPNIMEPPDPDPEVESALSNGLHRWRVFSRRGDEAPAGTDRFAHYRNPIFQQSVTLTAKMWPEDGDRAEGGSEGASGRAGGWAAWRVSGEHLPLVVGGVAGGALIVMLVVAAVVWRLCVLRRDKQYRVRMGECAPEPRPVQPVMPSESAVFASPVSGRWAYQSRLLGSPLGGGGTSTPPSLGMGTPLGTPPLGPPQPPQAWVYGDTVIAETMRPPSASPAISVHRSVSLQLANQSPRRGGCGSYGRPGPGGPGGRPLSAISSAGAGSFSAGCSPATPRHSALLPPPPPEFLLPDICEFNPGGSTQYASSSVLDDGGSLDGDQEALKALKTRSLPSSVRNKQKPLASSEDLDELYAKVNFSKKRKNRMRHDEAAIIAISKSRSQFLDKMATDGDNLADNEAVIVYNERTAL